MVLLTVPAARSKVQKPLYCILGATSRARLHTTFEMFSLTEGLKKTSVCVTTACLVGSVTKVEINDEFKYRVEELLCLSNFSDLFTFRIYT